MQSMKIENGNFHKFPFFNSLPFYNLLCQLAFFVCLQIIKQVFPYFRFHKFRYLLDLFCPLECFYKYVVPY